MLHQPFVRRDPKGCRPQGSRAARSWAAVAILSAGLFASPSVRAQTPTPPPGGDVVPAYAEAILNGTDNITQAGCASCGGGLPAPAITMPIGGGCGNGPCACTDDSCASCLCKPGKSKFCKCAQGCDDTFLGRLTGGFIECLCCPDPCYEGGWVYAANAAFFQDTVRPQSQMLLRWDSGQNLRQPERAEFFWARPGVLGGRGPRNIANRVDYDELVLHAEVATGAFAFFIDTPYRAVESDTNPGHSNFGDLNLGTKSLLVDCDLMQLTFQFRTYIPTASPQNGLGTGHTSLEPSALMAIKLMTDTYLQNQVAYWIPVGGDRDYQGAVWHYHTSLNRQFYKRGPIALIGTSEFNGWSFTDGAVANRALLAFVQPNAQNRDAFTQRGSGTTYLNLGGGIRMVFCDKFDIGFGSTFAITDGHLADNLYRTEFRVRY